MRQTKILLPLPTDMDEEEKSKARKLWSEIKEQTEVIAKITKTVLLMSIWLISILMSGHTFRR